MAKQNISSETINEQEPGRERDDHGSFESLLSSDCNH